MRYLENEDLVHRDLAARNVLLDRNGVAKVVIRLCKHYFAQEKSANHSISSKVADFGLSKGKEDVTDNDAFPILWSPPEVIWISKKLLKSKLAVDGNKIWAFLR